MTGTESTSHTPIAPDATPGHRSRYAFQAFVVLFALTMISGLALVLLSDARLARRFDLTSTRSHELSPQTRTILGELIGPTRLIVIANLSQSDAQSRRRMQDVLDKFSRGSDKLGVDVIDTSNPADATRFDALMRELATGEAPLIERHIAGTRTAIDALRSLAQAADQTVTSVEAMSRILESTVSSSATLSANDRTRAIDQLRSATGQELGLFRAIAEQLRQSAARCEGLLAENAAPLNVPKVDEAIIVARDAFRAAIPRLSQAADEAERRARPDTKDIVPAMREEATRLSLAINPARDAAARAAAQLESLPKIRVLSIAKALSRTQAALVIGPGAKPGEPARVTAVPIDELLPAPLITTDGKLITPPDQRQRAEERLTAALVAMTGRARPLAVFMHAAPQRGALASSELRQLVETLGVRGVDCDEWPIALGTALPQSVVDAGAANRPVVFVVIGQEATTLDSATHVGNLAKAAQTLFEDGRSVMFNVSLSSTRAAGAADAMVSFLQPLGLTVESGKPLMTESLAAARRQVSGVMQLTTAGTPHLMSAAVEGLTLRLPWCVPMRVAPVTGVDIQPVITIPASGSLWAESEWQTFRSFTDQQRATMSRLPAFDSPSDDNTAFAPGQPGAAWVVGVSIERTLPRGDRQRSLVFGSNSWFVDALAAQRANIDGRESLVFPANWELFIASINWLSGRDELIQRGVAATSVAMIPNLADSQLSALRWGLALGLPVLVLLIGASWRIWRG